ncbi:MAG: DUF523 domain-containing protein [Oscillospiraceae bacterium]
MKLLISGCLLGLSCRYDGGAKPMDEDKLKALMEKYELVPVCPESLGGLPAPREPSERRGYRVFSRTGADVTENFMRGAEQALYLARLFGCQAALLKERSPSCGSGSVYDGSFTGTLTQGDGIAAEVLKANGIRVYGESQIDQLL